jgi:arginyl-tRNA synthetase
VCRASKQKFDSDEGFKTRAREAVTRLQGGDEASLAAWRRICAASRQDFSTLYERLGVTLEERGESFYNPQLPGVVQELEGLGIVEDSDGAKVVWTDDDRKNVPPLMVQKGDGGYGYAR